ncbi:type II toxin-antitoxin system RelE/ParE family toxin [Lactobacillus sp. ESL0791]|nr:type II toxin-antitoxin system RelE/ParE family toxin [Lactobacillus sp. ESL0791]
MQDLGIETAIKRQWIKKLDNNLFEIRSKVGTNVQRAIYFHIENNHYIITHGFTKKSQRTPFKEIRHAKNLRSEWSKNYEK